MHKNNFIIIHIFFKKKKKVLDLKFINSLFNVPQSVFKFI